VVEGDEYDCAFFDKRPKFVHYLPDVAVVGNIEYDHADIYPDLAAVQAAFVRLLAVVPRRGLVLAGIESPALRPVLAHVHSRLETFAIDVPADWQAVQVRPDAGGTRFRVRKRGRDLGEFRTTLAGEHNVRNALAALAAAEAAGLPAEEARNALAAFRGVKRRLEVRGEAAGVTVYDDFAHHPTAIRETLRALRTAGSGRLVAVFEPRSYTSRTAVFQVAFAEALAGADRVVVAAAHLPEKVPADRRLSEAALVEDVGARGPRADFVRGVDDIVALLVTELKPGDRVAILSNGGFGGIHERLLRALEGRSAD
jgi:UDP-N-acetylmuramate: L-alanyl-gamma-D-glutamyl-meso-diaminopimelate ligase